MMDQTTPSGDRIETLTQQERLELESLRAVWMTLKPFLSTLSASVVVGQIDGKSASSLVEHAFSKHYMPLADAVLAHVTSFPETLRAQGEAEAA